MKLLHHIGHIYRDYIRIMRPHENVAIGITLFAGCLWFIYMYWGSGVFIVREIALLLISVVIMLTILAYGIHLGTKYSTVYASHRCEVEK